MIGFALVPALVLAVAPSPAAAPVPSPVAFPGADVARDPSGRYAIAMSPPTPDLASFA